MYRCAPVTVWSGLPIRMLTDEPLSLTEYPGFGVSDQTERTSIG